MRSEFGTIVSYYNGKTVSVNTAFTQLKSLVKEAIKIDEIITLNKQSLSKTTEYWDLLSDLSTMRTKLELVVNLNKWMRSSYIFGYENQSKMEQILKQRQTFENLSIELGSSDPNTDWVELALTNQVFELDYDKEGGNVLNVNRKNNEALNIQTTVDVMIGLNVLGKDISKDIEFIDDDMLTLGVEDTFYQSAEICLNVTRGSVPEFPFLGIPKSFIGTNVATLRSASLQREVLNNFRTDDSVKRVELLDSGTVEDVAFYDFKITSKLDTETNIKL